MYAKRYKRRRFRRSIARPIGNTGILRASRITSTNANNTGNPFPLCLATDSSGRWQFYAGITGSSVTGTNLSAEFCLSALNIYLNGVICCSCSLPSYTEYCALYESYRIRYVEVMVLCDFSANNVVAGTTSMSRLPFVVHAIDYDDSTSTPWNALVQYEGAKYTQFCYNGPEPKPLRIFRPRSRTPIALSSSTSTIAMQTPAQAWIDTSGTGPDTPHYGFKMALDNSNLTSTMTSTQVAQLNIIVKYHLEFKGPV